MNQTGMDVALTKMRAYVALAEEEIAERKTQCQKLQDELDSSRRLMDSLQQKLQEAEATVNRQQYVERVSQFKMEKIESGGTIQLSMAIGNSSVGVGGGMDSQLCQRKGCCRLERLYLCDGGYEEVQTECYALLLRPNVVMQKTSEAQGLYNVLLSNCGPCPSPERFDRMWPKIVADPALTMCDLWRGWTDMEQTYKKRERRTAMKRRTRCKTSVHEAFGANCISEDSTLFQAVCGFMEGSQEGYDDNKWFVTDYVKRLDKNESERKAIRATKFGRKELMTQMVSCMYSGDVAKQLEDNVLRRKRFSTVKLARVSDMNSSFNPSALGAIASCEGGKLKGEVGLLCGESTLRWCMDQVLQLAQQLGFYLLPLEHAGTLWCWGDESGALITGIHRYVKRIYVDACCDGVTKDSPWVVPLTGDAVRTSQRGTIVTVLGPKLADRRLVKQEQTGKTMCQSSDMYTPAVAGFMDETELMPWFHLLVAEFIKIEEQQFCIVKGKKYPVYLKVVVIADLSFLQKYVLRGGGSHSAT